MASYRLGLDIGTNSIGWCALRIGKDGNATGLLDWGSRIFGDGRNDKTGDSSAVERRGARGMRRRYDRKLMRKKAVLRMLESIGAKENVSKFLEEVPGTPQRAVRVRF